MFAGQDAIKTQDHRKMCNRQQAMGKRIRVSDGNNGTQAGSLCHQKGAGETRSFGDLEIFASQFVILISEL
jgi:hypothetical protein